MQISLIISTYNSVEWLEKVLISCDHQTYKDFNILIADDGSDEKTKKFIEQFQQTSKFSIIHVWQEDNGFQKTRILNKAIQSASGEYLIFTDGDCVLRKDFVATHVKYARKGYFLSGGYFKLPMSLSKKITSDDICKGTCFTTRWLHKNGLESSIKDLKLTQNRFLKMLLNFTTPTNASWNGHNASGWKSDLTEINGFDEEMKYGGEDRELGERLFNKGIKAKQIRYSAICIHLDHERNYVDENTLRKNDAIRKFTRENKVIWARNGIRKYPGTDTI